MLTRRHFLKALAAMMGGTLLARDPLWQALGQGQRFFIPPTIQHVTEDSATLYFRLGEPTSAGEVIVRQGGEVVQTVPFEAQSVLRQQIRLENLAPSTTYDYQVLVDGAELPVLTDPDPWTNLQFSTPPYDFPIRVGAIGDSGFGDNTTRDIGAAYGAADLDLFLHLGDVVYWMYQYNNDHFMNWHVKYFQPFREILRRVPHYATYGNHEGDGPARLDGWPSYFWMFPPFDEVNHEGARHWYSFDYNGIQFISLNSQLFYSFPDIRNAQEEFLDAQLARQDVRYRIVFCHIPPHTSTSVHQWDGMYLAEQWVPKFEAANVALVLNGHAHIYERLLLNGVNYVTAGAGSATTYGQGQRMDHSVTLYTDSSYPILELYEDYIHLTAYQADGTIIEDVDLAIPGL